MAFRFLLRADEMVMKGWIWWMMDDRCCGYMTWMMVPSVGTDSQKGMLTSESVLYISGIRINDDERSFYNHFRLTTYKAVMSEYLPTCLTYAFKIRHSTYLCTMYVYLAGKDFESAKLKKKKKKKKKKRKKKHGHREIGTDDCQVMSATFV